jgi:ankyrin repeat protein
LLDSKADPVAPAGHGATPLFLAVQYGQTEVIAAFIKKYNNLVNQPIKNGLNLLHIAVEAGQAKVVEQLLDAKADITISLPNKCKTPLYLAAQYGHTNVIDVFLKKLGPTILTQTMGDGYKLLHIAAQNGHAKAVEQLLNAGADPSATLPDGYKTPLYLAAQHGHTHVITTFLKKSDNRCHTVNQTMKNGWTLLHVAALYDQADVVKQLLREGANPNATLQGGTTALCIAVQKGKTKIIDEFKKLPEFKETANQLMKNGQALLHVAVKHKQAEVIKQLLDAGADPNVQMENGATPFLLAMQDGNFELAKLFLSHDSFINSNQVMVKFLNSCMPDPDDHNNTLKQLLQRKGIDNDLIEGITELHLAAFFGHLEILKSLLDNCADIHSEAQGISVLEMAVVANKKEIVDFILLRELASSNNQWEPIFDVDNKKTRGAKKIKEVLSFTREQFKQTLAASPNVEASFALYADFKKIEEAVLKLLELGYSTKPIKVTLIDEALAAYKNAAKGNFCVFQKAVEKIADRYYAPPLWNFQIASKITASVDITFQPKPASGLKLFNNRKEIAAMKESANPVLLKKTT